MNIITLFIICLTPVQCIPSQLCYGGNKRRAAYLEFTVTTTPVKLTQTDLLCCTILTEKKHSVALFFRKKLLRDRVIMNKNYGT